MYDYFESMKEDVLQAIEENYNVSDYEDREDFEQVLYDDLWMFDSVTGNASGSYTFNSYTAKEYVMDNMELCKEALKEFCVDGETIADHFLNEDYEYFDVTIRCYLLGQVIAEVLEDFDI